MTRLEDLRADFPALDNSIYLNVAARGLISRATSTAVNRVLAGYLYGDGVKEEWIEVGEKARQDFAHLYHARPGEIAFTKNVSDGLNTLITAMPWNEGDNVVLSPDFEHPNGVYSCLNLRRYGVDVRMVPLKDNALDVNALIENIDSRTRILTVSSVSFCTGFKADLASLGRACRSNGTFFLVDAAQSSGIIEIDVEASCIDGLATSTGKGLLGIYGQGFLFCSERWINRLIPAYLSRFGIDANGIHESEMGPIDYQLHDSARRFEVGNANWPGIFAVASAMEQVADIGHAEIERHSVALSKRLGDSLMALGYPVQQPPNENLRSHIVTVGNRAGYGAANPTDDHLFRLAEGLKLTGVVFSVRRGVLRLATHIYNNDQDIDTVLGVAARLA